MVCLQQTHISNDEIYKDSLARIDRCKMITEPLHRVCSRARAFGIVLISPLFSGLVYGKMAEPNLAINNDQDLTSAAVVRLRLLRLQHLPKLPLRFRHV